MLIESGFSLLKTYLRLVGERCEATSSFKANFEVRRIVASLEGRSYTLELERKI